MTNLHSEEFGDISKLRTGWPYLKGITVSQQGIGEAGTSAVSRATSARSPRLPRIVMNRNASVVWKGTLREGTGTMTTESGVLSDTRYSFHTRFTQGIGTNPDELIAASLGGCFSMFLANELGLSGFHPQRIETTATATLDDLAAGWTLTHIQLDVHANVPDASQACFMDAALAAKTKCPVARLLNTNISMTASLTNDLDRGLKRAKRMP